MKENQIKTAANVLLLVAIAVLASSAQTKYVDGVLAYASDATGCDIEPTPHYSQKNHPDTAATAAPSSTCSDLGSTYQIVSGGRLYGLRRTSADVQRDAKALAINGESSMGVLAFQPTGLHVLFVPNGNVATVKLHDRQSIYTVIFSR